MNNGNYIKIENYTIKIHYLYNIMFNLQKNINEINKQNTELRNKIIELENKNKEHENKIKILQNIIILFNNNWKRYI